MSIIEEIKQAYIDDYRKQNEDTCFLTDEEVSLMTPISDSEIIQEAEIYLNLLENKIYKLKEELKEIKKRKYDQTRFDIEKDISDDIIRYRILISNIRDEIEEFKQHSQENFVKK